MLLALRVVEGFSFATVVSAAPKIVLDASSRGDRDLALGIWSGYMPGGMALAMVVAPFVTEALGWRSLWWLSAGAALLTMALALAGTGRRYWPEQPQRDAHAGFDWAGAGATLPVGALWLYGGAFLLFTVQWFAVAAWLPTFLIETQGRGPTGAALFSALVVAMNATGNLIGGWLMHRRVPRYVLVGAANVVMGVTGALILAGSVPDEAKIPARDRLQHRQRHSAGGGVFGRGGACAEGRSRGDGQRLHGPGCRDRNADRAAPAGGRGRRPRRLGGCLVVHAGLPGRPASPSPSGLFRVERQRR